MGLAYFVEKQRHFLSIPATHSKQNTPTEKMLSLSVGILCTWVGFLPPARVAFNQRTENMKYETLFLPNILSDSGFQGRLPRAEVHSDHWFSLNSCRSQQRENKMDMLDICWWQKLERGQDPGSPWAVGQDVWGGAREQKRKRRGNVVSGASWPQDHFTLLIIEDPKELLVMWVLYINTYCIRN